MVKIILVLSVITLLGGVVVRGQGQDDVSSLVKGQRHAPQDSTLLAQVTIIPTSGLDVDHNTEPGDGYAFRSFKEESSTLPSTGKEGGPAFPSTGKEGGPALPSTGKEGGPALPAPKGSTPHRAPKPLTPVAKFIVAGNRLGSTENMSFEELVSQVNVEEKRLQRHKLKELRHRQELQRQREVRHARKHSLLEKKRRKVHQLDGQMKLLLKQRKKLLQVILDKQR
ncbi:hypothetical protein OTU49_016821, partial [Cherax quadricarinatus]